MVLRCGEDGVLRGGRQRGAGQAKKHVHRSLLPPYSQALKPWEVLEFHSGRWGWASAGGGVDEVLEGSKPPQAGSVSANTASSPPKAKPCGSTCLLP